MNMIIELLSKDLVLLISVVISIVSFVFILILAGYYRKVKEQQIISQIISSSEKEVQTTKKVPIETGKPVSTAEQQKISYQDFDIIVAQLNEIAKQINLINNHVKELSNTIKNLQDKSLGEEGIQEETIAKLVNVLHQVETQLNSFQQFTQSSSSSLEEINKKLDNLLRLLSTILQQ